MNNMDIPEEEQTMNKKQTLKPVSAAIGAAFAGSLAAMPGVQAADNPFAMTELSSGYMVAMEGKCGGSMNMKNMGEGKCGNMKNMKKHDDDKSSKEGKCGGSMNMKNMGEGKCGNMKNMKKHDDDKSSKEGKCGEGKCGEGMRM